MPGLRFFGLRWRIRLFFDGGGVGLRLVVGGASLPRRACFQRGGPGWLSLAG
ncbi:MAG: hypothetical protein ACR2N0_03955 [Rubrobacteraceae bacterium]|nr:hypothetical protein [Rubrobacter sp.]